MIEMEAVQDDFLREATEAVDQGLVSQKEAVRNLMDMIGIDVVNYLRGYTSQRQPPVRRGQADRKAHPGGWADVTSNLMNGFRYDVIEDAGSVWLQFSNSMEYAATLEARDGYFVLEGITDEGGPVEEALNKVISRVAPGWDLDRGR
jgi:hypothetical protein